MEGQNEAKGGDGKDVGRGFVSDALFCATQFFLLCCPTNAHLKLLVMYNASKKCLTTPTRQSNILGTCLLNKQGYQGKGLPCPRISASTVNFVCLIDPGFTVNSLQLLKL